MLPKSRRLTSVEVAAVLSRGRSLRAGTVSAKYLPAPAGKAAVVVSKKTARLATTRNKLRRAGYRALTTLPKAHLVVFIQKQEFDPNDILSVCSKLS